MGWYVIKMTNQTDHIDTLKHHIDALGYEQLRLQINDDVLYQGIEQVLNSVANQIKNSIKTQVEEQCWKQFNEHH